MHPPVASSPCLQNLDLQSHFRAFIQKNRNEDPEEMLVLPHSLQHYSQTPRDENNLIVHRETNGLKKSGIYTQRDMIHN